MKIFLLSIMLVLAIVFTVDAQTISQQAVKMQWDQVIYTNIAGWKFYVSKTSDGPFTEFGNIPYSSTLPAVDLAADTEYPEFQKKRYSQKIDIPDAIVTKGRVNRLWFKATSLRLDQIESGFSNVAFADIDLRPIPVPGLVAEQQ